MQIDSLDKLKTNEPLFKKVILAYWYSVPSDSDRIPDEIQDIKDLGTCFSIKLYQKSINYGYVSIPKYEIERYIIKLQGLKAHEDDIINRIDKE